ncbi:Sensor histidine kinase WalK [Arthrobacter sp. Bi26]|uniref:sensor histidine kinase n=1 Tax=Arthrobacter sp. Bi26 TaxID=2822350 RepID=UPI001D42EAF3|nr:HAMP domain-containing sensor histidine kinase [Arthrobacter sp. Bi26]CAH0163537.1 Sensor histidine kinase WalK [Arthrobacter sp. Bi26]
MSKQQLVRNQEGTFAGFPRRVRVALCQLPLTLAMTAVVLAAPWGWPGLFESGLWRAASALQLALFIACLLLPWQRFGLLAPLAIPVLDLAAICLIRSDSVEGLPDLGILAILPVLWITVSRLSGPAILSISFFGPLLTGLPWLLHAGSPPDRIAAAVLLPFITLAVSVVLRFARQELTGRLASQLHAGRERERLLNDEVSGLIDALSAKDDVVTTVSHEFRTPLTSIIGNLDLALSDSEQLSAQALRRLEVAQRNAERLLALVSDLLMSANSAVHIHPLRTDLASLVEASLGSAHAHAEASQVTLSMEVPAPLWAHVDPLRINQALDNLISNAIKYSPNGGSVRVSASTEGDRVLLHVEDDGLGMTATDAEQVFTRFFRSPAVRDGSIPGAGLGLSITKAIVERHGGSISCNTHLGSGSTFTLELPAEGAAPAYSQQAFP